MVYYMPGEVLFGFDKNFFFVVVHFGGKGADVEAQNLGYASEGF
jgi:hypothetical protein